MGRIKCGNMTNLFNADVLLYITRGVDAVLEIDINKAIYTFGQFGNIYCLKCTTQKV